MYEKFKSLLAACNFVEIVALLIYIMLCFGGITSSFLVIRVITALIALIASSIKCGAYVISDEKLGSAIFDMAIFLFNIILSAIMLI